MYLNFRRKIFWTFDKIKGSKIKSELNDILECFSQTSYENLQVKNKPILEKLLQDTVQNSPFYSKYKDFNDLLDFPVVNKSIIKENFDSINLNLESSINLTKVTTSGSTGIPFTIHQNDRKKTRNTADTIFFSKSSGFEIGNQLLYLRSWTAYLKKNKFLAKLQNINQLDVSDNTDEYFHKLIKEIQNNDSPKAWLGYPSGFQKICDYLDKINSKPLNCNVTSIIAMSEALTDTVKKRMEYYFQVPVVSRYSNIENGIIAQQMPGMDNFTINWASYIVEILDLNMDIPVKPGELGRIVVTDLYNTATPMIRYDTGDLGILTNEENSFPMLKSVYGRSLDAITGSNGKIINPFVIFGNFYKYPELVEIQLIQKSKNDYTFLLNCKEEFERKNEFITYFRSLLGKDANITIKFVDNIPTLKSGKRKIIVNDYKHIDS